MRGCHQRVHGDEPTGCRRIRHYVDNNSTPTMSSNLFEVQCFLALSSGSRSAMPSVLLLCATIVDLSCGYWRQYHLLTLSASGALNGVRRQKEL
jgi:hypothetical protein